VPLTQARMIAVLDEAHNALVAHQQLRADLYAALESNVPDGRKLELVVALLDRDGLALPLCERERAHFAEHVQRNRRSAARMRKARAQHKGAT
jgi:hypothetical protein